MKGKNLFNLWTILIILIILFSPLLAKQRKRIVPTKLKKSIAPVELKDGVLFTYKDKSAEKVTIAGSFNNWDANKQVLTKNRYGVWYIIFPLKKGKIEYKFVIDDAKWVKDPDNKRCAPDPYGGENSIFEVKREYDLGGVKMLKNSEVLFKFYAPNANTVYLVGSFNNWSTDADPMKKDKFGFWVIKKRLSPGTYQYKYIVDGTWTPDPMNKNTADDGLGGVNSVIEVR